MESDNQKKEGASGLVEPVCMENDLDFLERVFAVQDWIKRQKVPRKKKLFHHDIQALADILEAYENYPREVVQFALMKLEVLMKHGNMALEDHVRLLAEIFAVLDIRRGIRSDIGKKLAARFREIDDDIIELGKKIEAYDPAIEVDLEVKKEKTEKLGKSIKKLSLEEKELEELIAALGEEMQGLIANGDFGGVSEKSADINKLSERRENIVRDREILEKELASLKEKIGKLEDMRANIDYEEVVKRHDHVIQKRTELVEGVKKLIEAHGK